MKFNFFIFDLLSDIKLVNSLSLNLKPVDNFITIAIVNCSSDFKLVNLISHYSKNQGSYNGVDNVLGHKTPLL